MQIVVSQIVEGAARIVRIAHQFGNHQAQGAVLDRFDLGLEDADIDTAFPSQARDERGGDGIAGERQAHDRVAVLARRLLEAFDERGGRLEFEEVVEKVASQLGGRRGEEVADIGFLNQLAVGDQADPVQIDLTTSIS